MEGNPSSHSTPASGSSSNNSFRGTGGPSDFVDMLIRHIEEVMSAITDKGLHNDMLQSRVKLIDIVQPVTSDFSKIFEGISQGANAISDQMSSSSKLSGEANKMATDVVQALGDFHFASAGLLAIATVLERVEKISANDRDCLELIKAMLDLAKSIKQLTDINLHSTQRALSEKMTEAVHVICVGAIMCRSFIISKHIWKFLLTTKIRDELVRLWRKVEFVKVDLGLQMQIMISYSLSSCNMFRQPPFSVHEALPDLTEEFRTEEIMEVREEDDHGMEQRRQPLLGAAAQNLLLPASGRVVDNMEVVPYSNKNRRYKHQLESLFHSISKLLKKIIPKGHRNNARAIRRKGLDVQLSLSANARDFERITPRFTVKELRIATNGFKDELEDMKDSGYTAYRGTLQDMRPVVIKTACSGKGRVENHLLNELKTILCIRHRNILNLVGFCNDGEKLMLVYDYMANGNLHKMLFDPAEEKVLDWPTRLKILQGVISAIAYLHRGLDTCIVHRDIKSRNILLDEDFNPRISGFILGKPLHELGVPEETVVAGTIGYIDPEYMATGKLTEKVDIYSFGLVALEVVSGRKCNEFIANDDEILRDQAFRLEQEDQLEELADARLMKGGRYAYDGGGIVNTIRIALRCIRDRPSAFIVSEMLSHVQGEEDQSNVGPIQACHDTAEKNEEYEDEDVIVEGR